MTTYAIAFSHGEQQAFRDRRMGQWSPILIPPKTESERGYFDGYMPRGQQWLCKNTEKR